MEIALLSSVKTAFSQHTTIQLAQVRRYAIFLQYKVVSFFNFIFLLRFIKPKKNKNRV